MEAAKDLLDKYKKHPFAEGLLPFRPTLKALGSRFSKICARQDGRQRWVICDKATGEPALFSHAAVFAEGHSIETGNYVPTDQDIPEGIETKVVQRRANSRCFYSYVFDTYVDISLYEGQWSLDDYMSQVKGFNPGTLPRRVYLSGQDAKYRTRFWMQTPMFLRTGTLKDPEAVIDHLHPWVVQASRQSKLFRANPDRPRVWMRDGEVTMPITEGESGTLQRGDVVAFSFSVTYHVTSSNWFPQFHPADIVVLKASGGEPTDYSAPTIDLYSRPPPKFGAVGMITSDDEEESGNEVPKGGEASGVGGERLEEVMEGDETSARAEEVGDHQQEGVEGAAHEGGRRHGSSDTLGSSGDVVDGSGDGFELVRGGGDSADKENEEFVDVAVEEGSTRALRAGTAKSGRTGRKRL